MKRILTILVNASLSVYLMAGGIAPVQARQPAGGSRQPGAVGAIIYLPMVMKDISSLKAISVSVGENHACALTDAGGVKCWGYNQDGELGDGTKTDRPTPVDVMGLGSGVAAISAGYKHTCALTSLGGVKCWGSNLEGRLGNGTNTPSSTPVNVSGLASGVSAISAGGFHNCALTQTGAVKCWGDNSFGQLGVGDGTMLSSSMPVNVVALSSAVSAISSGGTHTCALMAGGGVMCWGDNGSGQLGNGTSEPKRLTPVNVIGLPGVVNAISTGGSHSCALMTGGRLECWGRNNYGQLGNGTTTATIEPVLVAGLAGGVGAVSAGSRHTCALMQAGGARCWGFNFYGQLGDGTSITRLAPVNVSVLSGALSSIGVGQSNTCARLLTGGVRCWGANSYGQLGNGSTTASSLPVIVTGFP
jgi:alpha-tubulin suppressor-like RCC1 family protein